MKEIKILGPGCPRCQELMKLAQQAVGELGLECRLEKVTDIQQITAHGVMMTPALVVDGKVKVSGRVPSVKEIKNLISE